MFSVGWDQFDNTLHWQQQTHWGPLSYWITAQADLNLQWSEHLRDRFSGDAVHLQMQYDLLKNMDVENGLDTYHP